MPWDARSAMRFLFNLHHHELHSCSNEGACWEEKGYSLRGSTSEQVDCSTQVSAQPAKSSCFTEGSIIPHHESRPSPYVAGLSCLVCGRKPVHAHHLHFAQPKALGRKVSDEFTVPYATCIIASFTLPAM